MEEQAARWAMISILEIGRRKIRVSKVGTLKIGI
jgi:hypothetical protein